MDFKNIKNIIFDLGNVVIDIDFELTYQAFADHIGVDLAEGTRLMEELKVYDRVERGEFTDEQFTTFLKENLKIDATHDQIICAWNSLLLELPKERVELIKKLGKKYRVFCLSNTSNPHILECNNILERSSGVKNLKELFEKAYYSYEIAMRKPDKEIYEYVLNDADIKAEETLFLDDNEQNIVSASELGIKTIHVVPPHTILDYLKNA